MRATAMGHSGRIPKTVSSVTLLLALLLLASCGRTTAKNTIIDAHQGKEALVMKFLPNMPPARVFSADPQSLQFAVQLHNNGAADLSAETLKLAIVGYDKKILTIEPDEQDLALPARSVENPQGTTKVATWTTTAINFPAKHDSISQSVTARACYRYQTIATQTICLDPKPEAQVKDKVCSPASTTLKNGQGGPVSVVKIDQALLPSVSRAQLKLTVQNLGKGEVINPDIALDKCVAGDLQVQDLGKVTVAARVNEQELTCTPITLYNKQGTSYCTLDGLPDTAFTTPVVITLSYGYTESISTTVEIVTSQEPDSPVGS